MKLETEYIIRLNFQEATALKAILGKESDNTKKEKGLDADESIAMALLYEDLPDKEEE